MMCCKPQWDGRTATCTSSALANDTSVGPTPNTGAWGWIRSKTSAPCAFPMCCGRPAPGLFKRTIWVIAGNTPSSWRKCPPEDCGGIPGFYDLVEAIADPNHEQHEELKDWLGYDFDPMDFSIDRVNQMRLPARRRGKTAKK